MRNFEQTVVMDSLTSVRLFVDVARSGSFSAVARDSGVATSSVTRQINTLEDSLRVRLLNRTTRRLSLTDVGQVFLEHAQRILADVDEAQRAVTELESAPRGRLRVSAPVVFGRLHIAPAIGRFLASYPELAVEVSLSDNMVNLVEESIDLAIRIAELNDSTLVARKLADMSRLICASPDYLARAGRPRTPADLAAHNCLTFRSNVSNEIWRASTRAWRLRSPTGEVLNVSVSGSLQTNNADVLLTAALDGLGLILVPDWTACRYVKSGQLEVVLPEFRAGISEAEPAIYAVYPSSRFLSPKVRAFIDFFVDELADVGQSC